MADKRKRANDKAAAKKAGAKKGDHKKKKKDAKSEEEGEEYEFPMPDFDERAFMRREIESAKATFWAAGLAVIAGVAAWAAHVYGGDWRLGFLVIFATAALLGPVLRKLGFSEDATSKKGLIGNWFFIAVTGFAVWVFTLNVL